MTKHRETFRRHGFGDYMIDFGDTTAEAIEAMATALVALEARSGASPASTESAALNANYDLYPMWSALDNVRLLAMRLRRTDPVNAGHLLRFCASAGVVGSVLRADADSDAAPLSMRDTILFTQVQERADKLLDADDQLRLSLARLAAITSSIPRESAEQIEFMAQGFLSRLEDVRAALDKKTAWAADLSSALSEELRQNAEAALGGATQRRAAARVLRDSSLGRHVCLNCGAHWKIEDGKEIRCPSCARVTGIEILSEDYVDVRGKRHDRRCDVAVYDDAHKPCSLGCGAKDPSATGRCAYALATSTDAPFPGYCGDVADPETARCADHRRIEAEAIARDERQRIASFLRLEADALERMGHQGAIVLRTEADAVERQPVGYVADALSPAVSGDRARRRTVNAKDVMLRLPHGETAPEKLYSFPNPDALIVAFRALNQEVYLFADDEQRSRDRVTVSYDHVAYVLMLAHAYLDLTMYELGQECCVEKLRDIWRARRAAAKG